MKPNKIDDIFQVRCGVPIIAGLYIGMDEDKAEELLEELTDCKTYHSYEYPADLIFQKQISFECDFEQYSSFVSSIRVIFPVECTTQDYPSAKKYFSEKYYHEKQREEIETDTEGNLLNLTFVLWNDYYEYALFNKEGKFIIQITGLKRSHIHSSFYIVATNPDLYAFIRKSLLLCFNKGDIDEYLNELFPVYYGCPSVCGIHLGAGCYSSTDAERKIDDTLHDPDMYYQYRDYRDIFFEVTVGWDERVEQIDLIISQENKDIALKLLQYLKQRFMIESAKYEMEYDEEGNLLIDTLMVNDYISIKINSPYFVSGYDCPDIKITIEVNKKDNGQLYEALCTLLCNKEHIGYFNAVEAFYEEGDSTQDAKFNDLRRKFDSFEAAANYYTAEHSAWARDMGGYSKEECERDTAACLRVWNTPESKGFPLSWIDVALPE